MAAMSIREMAERAREAARRLAVADPKLKDYALGRMAALLRDRAPELKAANARDLDAAGDLTSAMRDRLTLDDARIEKMAAGVEQVAKLYDPVGKVLWNRTRPNGMRIRKVRVPIGVVAIIYESRPNVTADAASLCLKSGNACILRGGKESINSNLAIEKMLREPLDGAGLPSDSIQVVPSTDRALVGELLKLDDLVDVVIPRGGKGLIRRVVEESTIPVIKHYEGICHVYVDSYADANGLDMAESIVVNAKTQRPGVCNAMETLLVHDAVAPEFVPRVVKALRDKGVEILGCPEARKIVPDLGEATDESYRTEWLGLKMSLRLVPDVESAVHHIETYGSHHSDAIVTFDEEATKYFLANVDSACVFHNVSTRFSDGFEFGMGAEIGISTDKLHARGPMGLEELTSYKYVVTGEGQLRT
ncbi:MAG: glutamate-5-semialdehyde dehydrogenase [Planctomycetota bacterium]|jgi:glutamate-5-semialdehyde dehydrogenase